MCRFIGECRTNVHGARISNMATDNVLMKTDHTVWQHFVRCGMEQSVS